jgi:hypothetical protein
VLRLLATVALAGLLAAAMTAASAARPAQLTGFWSPSRNIVCGYLPAEGGSQAFLRCDIRSGLRPKPRAACDLDWTGVSLAARTAARPTCAGDTVADPRFPVLPYGRAWRRGGFVCFSETIGVACLSPAGHGLFLSRQAWRTF